MTTTLSVNDQTTVNSAAHRIRFTRATSATGGYCYGRYTVGGERGAWLVKDGKRAVGTATTLDDARMLIAIDERNQREYDAREAPQRARDAFVRILRHDLADAMRQATRLGARLHESRFSELDANEAATAAAVMFVMGGVLDSLRELREGMGTTVTFSEIRRLALTRVLRSVRLGFGTLGGATRSEAAAYATVLHYLDGGDTSPAVEDGPISPAAWTD